MLQTLDSQSAVFQLKLKQIFRPVNLSSTRVKDTVGVLTSAPSTGMDKPEISALEFYYLNHAIADLSKGKTGYAKLTASELELTNHYAKVVRDTGTRMFYYLLLICTRESRHERTPRTEGFWTGLGTKYGADLVRFNELIEGSSSTSAVDKFKSAPPDMELGGYTKALCDIFYKGSFHSSYGGKPWGDISKCLSSFVNGETSIEAMIDTAYTLCHNNGPIFNKGMYFDGYTNYIYKILDVQRSGQIPQLVHSKDDINAGSYSSLYSHERLEKAKQVSSSALGAQFGKGYVDWFLVQELGALHSYNTEQSLQQKKYGKPKKAEAVIVKPAPQPTGLLDDIGLGAHTKIAPSLQVELVEVDRE